MNRALIGMAVALGALATLGALHSRGLGAAHAPTVAPAPKLGPIASDHSVAASPTPSSVDPEIERLETRRVLYESVDTLLQTGELEKARRLLDQDHEQHADDVASEWRDLEQSYRLIADCLEQPSAQKRARARAFALVSQAVALKARILDACQD